MMETRSSTRKRLATATGLPKITRPSPQSSALGSCLFHNDLIVSRIAKHLHTETLLALRPTCINWNQLFVPQIQECHPPIIIKAHFGNDPTTNMRAYTKVMLRSGQIPYTKYWLALVTCPRTLALFTELGDSITSLALDNIWGHLKNGVHLMRKIIFDRTPNLQNLELEFGFEDPPTSRAQTVAPGLQLPKLRRLGLKWGPDEELYPWLLSFVKDILRASVALDCLLVRGHSGASNLAIMESVRDLVQNIHKLKSLTIDAVYPPELEILIALTLRKRQPLHLETFGTTFRYDRENQAEAARLLREFLIQQSVHLRQLRIELFSYRYYDLTNNVLALPLRIPQMENLQSFEFNGCGLWRLNLQFEAGSLHQSFPNLQRFECKNQSFNLTEVDFLADPNMLQHTGVTEFNFDARITQPPTLLQLDQFYPSVIHAELLLNKCNNDPAILHAIRSSIWTTWPLLQTLKLHCDPCYGPAMDFDGMLTGVEANRLGDLEKELERGTYNVEEVCALQRKYKTRPGLPDLRHLRKFSIRMEQGFSSGTNITDIGGYFGFAMASPTLQYLSCTSKYKMKGPCPFGGKTMSPECKTFIRNALGPTVDLQFD